MDIDWTAARFFLDVALVAGMIYVWWTNRNRATAASIREVDKRVDQLDAQLKRRPSFDDLDRIRDDMHGISRGMAEISTQMQATNSLLNRLHEYLLTERGNHRRDQ
ncbi:hypothetical protein PRZ61_12335 [Halomonas pacifica]|uniref:hypothetical protein n=1 Tax=Bisbaumannia pacifica TaxID=77098 RepID=UPI00235925E1|nr:hypothetical protein [Halomonas pacifica]MDC8804230.1 hypothetical protein [Halomonas pacifica]